MDGYGSPSAWYTKPTITGQNSMHCHIVGIFRWRRKDPLRATEKTLLLVKIFIFVFAIFTSYDTIFTTWLHFFSIVKRHAGELQYSNKNSKITEIVHIQYFFFEKEH
jgi:hypothetical protein